MASGRAARLSALGLPSLSLAAFVLAFSSSFGGGDAWFSSARTNTVPTRQNAHSKIALRKKVFLKAVMIGGLCVFFSILFWFPSICGFRIVTAINLLSDCCVLDIVPNNHSDGYV